MINRLKKFICICGVCVLSLTTMSFMTVANAEDYVDENGGEAVYTTAPAAVNTEPVYTQSQEPANNSNNNNANNYAQDDYTQAPVANNSNDTNNDVNTANYNFYNDDGEVSDSNDDTSSDTDTNNDDGTDSDSQNSETTTPTYSNVKEIDDTELKDSDWDKISKDLSKKKVKGDSSSPFDYIKNSEKATGWDAFINSLNWASTLALVAFGLALVCIIIFIVFTIKKIRLRRKGLPNVKVKSGKSDKNGSHSIIEDDEEDNFDEGSSLDDADSQKSVDVSSYAKPAHGGAEDYGDDFDDEDFDDVHYVKPAEKSKKKKLKQDTSEIIIPNKYKR